MLAVSTFAVLLGVVAVFALIFVGKFRDSRRAFYASLALPTSELSHIRYWIEANVMLNPNGSEMACWHLWLGREAAAKGANAQAQAKIAEVMAECEQVGARRNPTFGPLTVAELRSMASGYVFNGLST